MLTAERRRRHAGAGASSRASTSSAAVDKVATRKSGAFGTGLTDKKMTVNTVLSVLVRLGSAGLCVYIGGIFFSITFFSITRL